MIKEVQARTLDYLLNRFDRVVAQYKSIITPLNCKILVGIDDTFVQNKTCISGKSYLSKKILFWPFFVLD